MRFLIALALAATLSGQDLPFLRQPPSHVTVSTSVSASTTASTSETSQRKNAGPTQASTSETSQRSVRLIADITPKPDIHVYAPGAEGYEAVRIEIEPRTGIKAGAIRYPKSEMLVTGAERVPVFSKPFQLAVPVTIDRKAAGTAPITVTGKIRLQACDDQVCYKPETVAVSWEIRN